MELRSTGGAPREPGPVRVRILHTNDLHGAISPGPDRVVLGRPAELGGSAYLASLVARLRAEDPGRTLLLDSGDAVHGDPSTDLDHGNSMMAVMDAVGYDAGTLGNHEFQWGVPDAVERLEHSSHPVVIANLVQDDGTPLPRTEPYRLFDLDGVRVGVTGLLTSATAVEQPAHRVEGVRFLDETEALRRSVEELRSQGAEAILVMSHMGLDEDRAMAARFPDAGLVFLGGHTHDRLADPEQVAGNYIVQAGALGREVGDLTLEVHKRSVVSVEHRLIPVDPSQVPPDPEVAALVARYEDRADREMGEVLAHLPERLGRSSRVDSPVGRLVTDAIRKAGGADVAFLNSSALRADLQPGPLSRKSLYAAMPFGGEVMKGTLTGRQIQDALEHSVARRAASGREQTPFLQVSGLEFAYDASRPAGSRVLEVRVGGAPLDPEAAYTVALDDFLSSGRMGFDTFREARWTPAGVERLDAMADFAATSPLPGPGSSRIEDRTPGS